VEDAEGESLFGDAMLECVDPVSHVSSCA
jgi:hypothetical protein